MRRTDAEGGVPPLVGIDRHCRSDVILTDAVRELGLDVHFGNGKVCSLDVILHDTSGAQRIHSVCTDVPDDVCADGGAAHDESQGGWCTALLRLGGGGEHVNLILCDRGTIGDDYAVAAILRERDRKVDTRLSIHEFYLSDRAARVQCLVRLQRKAGTI